MTEVEQLKKELASEKFMHGLTKQLHERLKESYQANIDRMEAEMWDYLGNVKNKKAAIECLKKENL